MHMYMYMNVSMCTMQVLASMEYLHLFMYICTLVCMYA